MFAALCRDAAMSTIAFRRGELCKTPTFPTSQGIVELRPPVNFRIYFPKNVWTLKGTGAGMGLMATKGFSC